MKDISAGVLGLCFVNKSLLKLRQRDNALCCFIILVYLLFVACRKKKGEDLTSLEFVS